MRIIFLAPFGIRPKGTLIARMIPLAAELQELGHEVHIIAPPYTNPEDSGLSEVVQGVTIQNIVLAGGGRALSALPNALRMLSATMGLKPDLIHLFKPKGYGGIAAILILLQGRLGFSMPPLVVDTDDWEGQGGMNERLGYSSLERFVYTAQERWLLKHAQAITAASRELVRLCGAFREGGLISYLPNGYVAAVTGRDRKVVRMQYGIAPETPVLLLYTRFFEFTQDRLYRLLDELFRSVEGLKVLVIGSGPHNEEQQLAGWAKEHGRSGAVINCGWLEPVNIPEHIVACDAAVYLFDDTLVNKTKCPAKLVEIIGQGVPVVAERIGQASEYIRDGVGGYLVACSDVHATVTQLTGLLQNCSRAQEIGALGRQNIITSFSWPKLTRSIAKLYESVVER